MFHSLLFSFTYYAMVNPLKLVRGYPDHWELFFYNGSEKPSTNIFNIGDKKDLGFV